MKLISSTRVFDSDNRQSKVCPEPSRRIQNRKLVGLIAIVVAFALCEARAEQTGKVPAFGFCAPAYA
jgi:hypothetical protein